MSSCCLPCYYVFVPLFAFVLSSGEIGTPSTSRNRHTMLVWVILEGSYKVYQSFACLVAPVSSTPQSPLQRTKQQLLQQLYTVTQLNTPQKLNFERTNTPFCQLKDSDISTGRSNLLHRLYMTPISHICKKNKQQKHKFTGKAKHRCGRRGERSCWIHYFLREYPVCHFFLEFTTYMRTWLKKERHISLRLRCFPSKIHFTTSFITHSVVYIGRMLIGPINFI